MRGRDIIGLVLVGVLLTLAVGGYLVYELQGEDEAPTEVAKDTNTSTTPRQSTAPVAQSPQSSASQGLQVQGVADEPATPNQTTILGPESFTQYEQHANADSPLYTELVIGNGTTAQRGDRVAVLYKGWLTNGQLFDQTTANEEGLLVPFVFQLGAGQVIQGWDVGVEGMKKGGKRRLIIPSSFGYGPAGKDPIPPNAMMIFDVELVDVAPQQQEGL